MKASARRTCIRVSTLEEQLQAMQRRVLEIERSMPRGVTSDWHTEKRLHAINDMLGHLTEEEYGDLASECVKDGVPLDQESTDTMTLPVGGEHLATFLYQLANSMYYHELNGATVQEMHQKMEAAIKDAEDTMNLAREWQNVQNSARRLIRMLCRLIEPWMNSLVMDGESTSDRIGAIQTRISKLAHLKQPTDIEPDDINHLYTDLRHLQEKAVPLPYQVVMRLLLKHIVETPSTDERDNVFLHHLLMKNVWEQTDVQRLGDIATNLTLEDNVWAQTVGNQDHETLKRLKEFSPQQGISLINEQLLKKDADLKWKDVQIQKLTQENAEMRTQCQQLSQQLIETRKRLATAEEQVETQRRKMQRIEAKLSRSQEERLLIEEPKPTLAELEPVPKRLGIERFATVTYSLKVLRGLPDTVTKIYARRDDWVTSQMQQGFSQWMEQLGRFPINGLVPLAEYLALAETYRQLEVHLRNVDVATYREALRALEIYADD